jgi:hypothetical protein
MNLGAWQAAPWRPQQDAVDAIASSMTSTSL